MVGDDHEYARQRAGESAKISPQAPKEPGQKEQLPGQSSLALGHFLHNGGLAPTGGEQKGEIRAEEKHERGQQEQHGSHVYGCLHAATFPAISRTNPGSVPQHPPITSTPAETSAGTYAAYSS